MSETKSVGRGFVAGASLIALFVTVVWLLNAYLNPWIGVPVFLLLAFPFAINSISDLKALNEKKPAQTHVKQAKNFLMALPGAGVACWFFDVLSTIFVINLAQSGTELNPLGWPYSAPAALAYFVPIIFITYYLLFKIRKPASFWVAVAISAATIFMSARSLLAGLNNFGPEISTVYSSNPSVASLEIMCIWYALVSVLAAFNLALVKAEKTSVNLVARFFCFSVPAF